MASLKDYLKAQKLLDTIPVPTAIDVLLNGLQIAEATPADTGTVQAGANGRPIGIGLALAPFGPPVPYTIVKSATGFALTLDLTKVTSADKGLALLGDGISAGLIAAVEKILPSGNDANGQPLAPQEWLEPAPDPAVKLTGPGLAVVIEGTNGSGATLRLSPSPGEPEGLIALKLDPATVLLGDSTFGLKLGGGLLLDLSKTKSPDVKAIVDGVAIGLPSDTDPTWRGIAIRQARLYLPDGVPLFGRTACDCAFDIGISPAGIAMVLSAKVPARDDRPAMTLRIECIDPTATGLASFAPTLVEATITLPLDQHKEQVAGDSVQFGAGTPVIARARFSRDPTAADGLTRLAIALEAQGPNGILSVKPKDADDKLAIWLIGAAGFATALVANRKVGKQGGTMASLMILGGVLAAILSPDGKLIVNRIELDSDGHGLPVGGPIAFLVDYSVDVPIKPLNIGLLSISLDPQELLRIRMRGVKLSYDPAKSGLDRVDLDFAHAVMDVEDPGKWLVNGPGSLFDVIGTRSGKGSVWLEIDLRFKLDLGPVKVSGATIRATLADDGGFSVGLRGLDASLSIPALVSAEGKIALNAPNGFSARLDAKILPLNVAADAWITVAPPMVLVGLGIDLPGPIPLGATGLGLFGLGGTVGIAAAITLPAGGDPIAAQLQWTPETGFKAAPGQFSFGVQASVGTLPDLGFDFAAKAGLFLTVPDLAVLGALDARFLAGPISMTEAKAKPAANGVRGTVSVLPGKGTQFAIEGNFGVPQLLTAKVPVAGAFPPGSNDWYVYVGSDGFDDHNGRGIGPVRMTVLPGLFPQTADAYLMLRGQGLTNWPRGQNVLTIPDGFVIAFGFGMEMRFGPKPVAWAEVSGGVDVVVATAPLVIAGFGRIDGALHLGPVSLGVSAKLLVLMTSNSTFVQAEVCGRIHLLFVTIHKCAKLSFGGQVTPVIPDPAQTPIDRMGQDAAGKPIVIGQNVALVDDTYRQIAFLSRDPGTVPTVWPDTLIRIGFAWAPQIDAGALGQFDAGQPEGPGAQPIGSGFLRYDWRLVKIALIDQTTGQPVAGPLSGSWQVGRAGDAGKLAQPAELMLLTPQADLWLDRVADPTKPGTADPLAALGTSCQAQAAATIGWTVATSIAKIMQPTWLPPETLSMDPTASRVGGVLAFAAGNADGSTMAIEAMLAILPAGSAFVPPLPLAVPEALAGRSFMGLLTLPFVKGALPTARPLASNGWFDAVILLDDALIADGVLAAMCLDVVTPEAFAGAKAIRVFDETGDWTLTTAPLPSKQLALTFRMPAPRKATRVTIRWQAQGHFAWLGLGGVTAAAAKAAAAKQQALDAQKAKNAAAAGATPAGAGDPNDAVHRCLLQPGRSYRIDIALAWRATLFKQGDNGQQTVDSTRTGAPPVQSFFFATAPDPFAAGGSGTPVALKPVGDPDQLASLYDSRNGFAPEMLVRHLAGYEPAQSVVDRFCNDPLRVHFDVEHVVALAGLYGYALKLALRRTDMPGDAGNLTFPAVQLRKPTNGAFLDGAARAHWDLAQTSPCPVPVEGATMDAPVALQPRAWYETFVQAGHAQAPDAALPGVTFRTSRWPDATAMLAGIGFPTSGSGQRSGDLAIGATLPPIVAGASDTAFDAALAALGLGGWPVPAEPRASLLWQPLGGGWAVAGLLLESPEPIERPGRVGPAALAARLAPSHAAVAFETKVRDRTGSRLLWLTATPFVPARWLVSRIGPIGGKGDVIGGGVIGGGVIGGGVIGGGVIGGGRAGPIFGGGGGIGSPLFRTPQLALSMLDMPLDASQANLIGLLTLPSAPLFAGEAF